MNAKLKDKVNHILFVLRGSFPNLVQPTKSGAQSVSIVICLTNMCIYYNNFVANQNLKHFDGVSFR